MKDNSQSSNETQIPTTTAARANSADAALTAESRPAGAPDQRAVDPATDQSAPSEGQTHEVLTAVILPSQPEFRLEKRSDGWMVRRGSQQSVAEPEIGLDYVDWFLRHPGESFHALDLAARIHATSGRCKYTGLTEVEDLRTGKRVPVEAGARVQERGMYLEEAETMRAVLREQERLEALVQSDDITEPEKEEAYRQLIALYDYEKNGGARVRDAAGRASDAVGRALVRLQKHLEAAVDAQGQPDEVLRGFAEHIRQCILKPSRRGGFGARKKRTHGGWFVYET